MTLDDPFALLGLPRRFDVEPALVNAAHRRRAASLHPDRVVDPILQAEAAAEMARLNEARATLLDDERRANALLILLGGASKETDKSLPDGFLVDMMEARQEMEADLESDDSIKAEPKAKWEAWGEARRHEHRAAVADLFKKAQEDGDARAAALKEIRTRLNAWRYIERLLEQIDGPRLD